MSILSIRFLSPIVHETERKGLLIFVPSYRYMFAYKLENGEFSYLTGFECAGDDLVGCTISL